MSLIPVFVMDAFITAGLVPVARGGPNVQSVVVDLYDITPGDTHGAAPLVVRRLSGAPTPRALEQLLARARRSIEPDSAGLLVVCDHASNGSLRRAAELGISLVGIEDASLPRPTGAVRLRGGRELPLTPRPSAPTAVVHRTSWARVQVLRSQVLLGRLTQRDIAALAGVSQPRVSQAVASLELDDQPRAVLVDRWLDSYPGPGGVTTYWFGLESPREQARTAVRALQGARPAAAVVSGDVAADAVAPVARPMRAVVYSRTGLDLRTAGLTPALSSEATLELTVPQDRGVFSFADRYWRALRPRDDAQPADPLQLLYDIRRSPSIDRDQSEQAVRRLLERPVAPQEL